MAGATAGVPDCEGMEWRPGDSELALGASCCFGCVLVLALVSWLLAACERDAGGEREGLRRRRPSLTLPLTQRRMLTTFTPDTRAIVASSRAVLLGWTAFVIVPQSPIPLELAELTRKASQHARSWGNGMAASAPGASAQGASHDTASRAAPSGPKTRTPGPAQSKSFSLAAEVMGQDAEWDPNADATEAVEAEGVTSRSRIASVAAPAAPGVEESVLSTIHRTTSMASFANGGTVVGGGQPAQRVRVVLRAPDGAGKSPGSGCYGQRMRQACGNTAAGHSRRAVILVSLSAGLWGILACCLDGDRPQWAAWVVGTLWGIGWAGFLWLCSVFVWYWTRLARSARRLRTIHEIVRLRDMGMVGDGSLWSENRQAGGLAGPFDATADPYAVSLLSFWGTVGAVMAVALISSSIAAELELAACAANGPIEQRRGPNPRQAMVGTVVATLAMLVAMGFLSGRQLIVRFGVLTDHAHKAAVAKPVTRAPAPNRTSSVSRFGSVTSTANFSTNRTSKQSQRSSQTAGVCPSSPVVAPMAVGHAILEASGAVPMSATGRESTSPKAGKAGDIILSASSTASLTARGDASPMPGRRRSAATQRLAAIKQKRLREEAEQWSAALKAIQRRLACLIGAMAIVCVCELAHLFVRPSSDPSGVLHIAIGALRVIVVCSVVLSAWFGTVPESVVAIGSVLCCSCRCLCSGSLTASAARVGPMMGVASGAPSAASQS